jgi:hypothetical protein
MHTFMRVRIRFHIQNDNSKINGITNVIITSYLIIITLLQVLMRPLRLSPPSRRFQRNMSCSQGVNNYIYNNICKIGK